MTPLQPPFTSFAPLPLLLLVAGCGGGATPTAVDAAGDRRPAWPTWDAAAPDCRGEVINLQFANPPANLLVLFDRSSSMSFEFGSGTRYSVEAEILSSVVSAYEDKLRFGFQAFPAPDDRAVCGGRGFSLGCCVEPPSVPVGLTNARAITAAIAAAAPVSGGTPTAGALRLARDYFEALNDGIEGRYVLLSTDDAPGCTADGRLGPPFVLDAKGDPIGGTCFDAWLAVDELRAIGVKVIVLAVGPGVDRQTGSGVSCLDELAVRGGMPRSDSRPRFFTADDPAQLEAAIETIFGGVIKPSCVFPLAGRPHDPTMITVLLDGTEIRRAPGQGWDYRPTGGGPGGDQAVVELYGEHCNRVRRFQVSTVEVRYGCPPCPADGGCE